MNEEKKATYIKTMMEDAGIFYMGMDSLNTHVYEGVMSFHVELDHGYEKWMERNCDEGEVFETVNERILYTLEEMKVLFPKALFTKNPKEAWVNLKLADFEPVHEWTF